jgi:hypothetical protein
MASWKSNSLKVSLLVCDGPSLRDFSLIGFDSTTDDLDHPLSTKQADPPHSVPGSLTVLSAKVIDTVLAEVLFEDATLPSSTVPVNANNPMMSDPEPQMLPPSNSIRSCMG